MPDNPFLREVQRHLSKILFRLGLKKGRPMRGRSSSQIKDKLPQVRGGLEIIRRNVHTGEEEVVVNDQNLVVTDGREIVASLLSGDDAGVDDFILDQMAWGDGGHDTGDPTTAIPPQPSDNALANELLKKDVTSHDFPNSTTVRFIGIIDQTELNGVGISEAGLLAANDKLFARKTFGILTKTADFAFEFRWSILA